MLSTLVTYSHLNLSDSIQTEHTLNIILEFVENGSLESVIKKYGKLHEALAAIYVEQVLHGLDYLHT